MNRFHRWFCRSALWRRSLSETILPWALQDAELGQHILEVGPGPGLTTDILRRRFWQITSVEIDHRLADALRQRMIGTNVTVIEGDATAMPFADGSFTGAVSFTMLHHVPIPDAAGSTTRRSLSCIAARWHVYWNGQPVESQLSACASQGHDGNCQS